MSKSTTSSYVLTLKLNTDASDKAFLNKRFFLSCIVYNRLVSHVKVQLAKLSVQTIVAKKTVFEKG